MTHFIKIIAVCLTLALPALSSASTWSIDPDHSNIGFKVKHLMVSNVNGNFGKHSGTVTINDKDITKSKIEITIDTNSLNTNVQKRDEHLRSADFFDVAKYPTMTFASKKVAKAGKNKLKVTGDLTLHGVTKEVVLDVEGPSKESKDPWGNIRKGAAATTKINRKDFGLIWNKSLETGGVLVGDQIIINLEVEMIKDKETSALLNPDTQNLWLEVVETTYNGKLCYTPVFAVVGRERFCIKHWLLPSREKALERIDEFIRECAERLPETIDRKKLLFRYDAGLYSIKTVKASEDAGAYYLVQARGSAALDRMVNENLDVDVLDLKVTDFGGEYFGEFEYTPSGWKTPRRFVFCVQIKAEDEKGQPLLIKDVHYHILATNLPEEVSPQRAFELYRGRGE